MPDSKPGGASQILSGRDVLAGTCGTRARSALELHELALNEEAVVPVTSSIVLPGGTTECYQAVSPE